MSGGHQLFELGKGTWTQRVGPAHSTHSDPPGPAGVRELVKLRGFVPEKRGRILLWGEGPHCWRRKSPSPPCGPRQRPLGILCPVPRGTEGLTTTVSGRPRAHAPGRCRGTGRAQTPRGQMRDCRANSFLNNKICLYYNKVCDRNDNICLCYNTGAPGSLRAKPRQCQVSAGISRENFSSHFSLPRCPAVLRD